MRIPAVYDLCALHRYNCHMEKLSLEALDRLSPQAYQQADKTPVVLLLDNVRSALNVGSIFRTADAFRLSHIYLCGITVQPPHREILKTALGATDTVAWTYVENSAEAVSRLQADNYAVYAVEQARNSILLTDFQPPPAQPLALIFGNEVKGVSDDVMAGVDAAIEVPQFGTKHSLNIAVCVGIVVWDVFVKGQYARAW